jgi:ketosteroid isomerase-like protein
MEGRDAIHAYWSEIIPTQDDISFDAEILSVGGDRAFVHWHTSLTWRPTGERRQLDGVFILSFDAGGRCSSLQEWWHAEPPFPD